MKITKALIVAAPWIDHLLDGSKTWEMRSTRTSHREWFGLIRKGSGEIHGIARLVGVGAPLSLSEMIETYENHRIPEQMIRSGAVAKWNTPWKLADVQRLSKPIAYEHKNGAVTWVELDAYAAEAVSKMITAFREPSDLPESPVAPSASKSVESLELPNPTGERVLGAIRITEGNIANSHIYLRSIFSRFPNDAVGGSNKSNAARRNITVDWGGPDPIITDLDGEKKIFRT